ncbi:NAD(P)-binding domain-containing protein [Amnibacterium sp. CER49]|uniref:flavin-containing monooxygenase n=1 Tax=Amnibacterium sp. CER49 TaxID=3039161 RepID=UPI0024475AE9|nr:NAD(P)-binding domain-containing protein [Amnibacterium sp. CER49]MDH2442730.1 NAD(P)-binding domain-containing protein [Amnibacterium sp. CER49]
MSVERFDVAVVGGGVAGLITGRRIAERGLRSVILDEHERVGDAWRERYESLRLFSYRRYASPPGAPLPMARWDCPTGVQLADHLEAMVRREALPVRCGVRVDRLSRRADGTFVLETTSAGAASRVLADAVVVATGAHRRPVVPPFADLLDPGIPQLHSLGYRSAAGLAPGPVLVVGAGNSGTDIALDAARAGHETVLAGRHPGQTPFELDSPRGRLASTAMLFALRHLTVRTPMGRRMKERLRDHGLLLIRNKLAHLDAAGVRRLGRVVGARNGLPVVAGGDVLRPGTIVWATGSRPDLRFLDVEGALDDDGEPVQTEGIADRVPGLGFVGLDFQYSAASGTIQGMDRDARAVLRALLAPARRRSHTVAA